MSHARLAKLREKREKERRSMVKERLLELKEARELSSLLGKRPRVKK